MSLIARTPNRYGGFIQIDSYSPHQDDEISPVKIRDTETARHDISEYHMYADICISLRYRFIERKHDMITIQPSHGQSITRYLLDHDTYHMRIARIVEVIVFTESLRFVRVMREYFDNTYLGANDTIVAIYGDDDSGNDDVDNNLMLASDMIYAHKYMMRMISDEIVQTLPLHACPRIFTDAEWQVTGRDY